MLCAASSPAPGNRGKLRSREPSLRAAASCFRCAFREQSLLCFPFRGSLFAHQSPWAPECQSKPGINMVYPFMVTVPQPTCLLLVARSRMLQTVLPAPPGRGGPQLAGQRSEGVQRIRELLLLRLAPARDRGASRSSSCWHRFIPTHSVQIVCLSCHGSSGLNSRKRKTQSKRRHRPNAVQTPTSSRPPARLWHPGPG